MSVEKRGPLCSGGTHLFNFWSGKINIFVNIQEKNCMGVIIISAELIDDLELGQKKIDLMFIHTHSYKYRRQSNN